VVSASRTLRCIALHLDETTERKNAELHLLQSERKFRSILESAATPVLVLDDEGRVVLMNTETEQLFDTTFETLYNERISDHVQGFEHHLRRTLEQPSVPVRFGDPAPIRAITKTGREVFIACSLSAVRIDEAVFMLAVLVDITNRVHYEEAVKMRTEQLRSIAQMQSHDVRRPLANLLGLVELLEAGGADSDMLSALKNEAHALDAVIHSIVTRSSER
jgi:PAS domain S-box-containing protein